MKLYKRTDLHLQRKAWHMTGVLVLWWFHQVFEHETLNPVFIGLMIFAIVTEAARKVSPSINKLVVRIMFPFMRKHEISGISGSTPLLVAVNLLNFFPDEIASLSLLFLAFADPGASLVGVMWGKTKLTAGKSLEGSVAALVICSFIVWNTFSQYWIEIILFGLIGSLAELLPLGKIDDNFSMPLVTALLLLGYQYLV